MHLVHPELFFDAEFDKLKHVNSWIGPVLWRNVFASYVESP